MIERSSASDHITALLGPNGAGKTTFVSAGHAIETRVAGIDVRADPKRIRQIIGLVGQYASIEPAMTGTENLRLVARLFGLDRREARTAAAVLERLGLAHPAIVSCAITRAACAADSTWARAWLANPAAAPRRAHDWPRPPRPHRALGRHPGLVADGTDVLLTTQYLAEADQLARTS